MVTQNVRIFMGYYNIDIFYTEKYIDYILQNYVSSLSKNDLKILEKLCKKIDVAKTI
jgi:hypothetical protein